MKRITPRIERIAAAAENIFGEEADDLQFVHAIMARVNYHPGSIKRMLVACPLRPYPGEAIARGSLSRITPAEHRPRGVGWGVPPRSRAACMLQVPFLFRAVLV